MHCVPSIQSWYSTVVMRLLQGSHAAASGQAKRTFVFGSIRARGDLHESDSDEAACWKACTVQHASSSTSE